MSQSFDQELDCKGLSCPMPILKTKKAIDKMESGQVLKMFATDPGAIPDMEAWTSKTGHEMLSHEKDGDVFTFYVKKK